MIVLVDDKPSNIVFMGRFFQLCWRIVIVHIPPKLGLYPGNDFQRIKRFCDIIVGPDGQPHDLVLIRRLCGQHDDRVVGGFSDLLADLKTIRVREHHIQNCQV